MEVGRTVGCLNERRGIKKGRRVWGSRKQREKFPADVGGGNRSVG